MKKNIYMWLTALMVLLTSFQGSAMLKTTITWNVPGSLQVYVGGTGAGNKAVIPSDATSFQAVLDQSYGSCYLEKAPGYEFESVTIDGTALSAIPNGMYRIDMSENDGKTVVVKMEEVTFDSSFSLNVVNGRDALTVTMWGTGREIKVKTGMQEIPYSTKYEKGVAIEAKVAGSENPVLKQDNVEMEWKAYYNWDSVLYHKDAASGNKGFPFSAGTNFYVKYCETPDETEAEEVTVNLNFTGFGEQALIMLFNVTESKSIPLASTFTVKKGDEIRLVFDSKNYVNTVNGYTVEPLDVNADSCSYEFTVNADANVTIGATERVWAKTTVSFAISDLEGVVLREGSFNGPEIDKSTLTSMDTVTYSYEDYNKNKKSATLTTYQAEVSLKSPKVYISEAPGYWFAACDYKDGSDPVPSTVASTDNFIYCVDKKINLDTKVVVYLSTDGVDATPEVITFRDRNRNVKALDNGYNEFMFDSEYSSPLSILGMLPDESTAMAVYYDMSGISKDEESGAYNMDLEGDAAIHVFAGRPAPATYTVSVYTTPDANDAEVVIDRVRKVTTGSALAFKNCEISVNPASHTYYVNGVAPEYEGEVHNFTATEDTAILLGNVALMNVTPADGAEVEEFSSMVVSFPNATSAVINEELVADITLSDAAQVKYGCMSFTVEAVIGANAPTFRVSVANYPAPSTSGLYKLVLPEGLFTVQGSMPSEALETYFTINKQTATEDIPVNYSVEECISFEDFFGLEILFGEDVGDYTMTPTEGLDNLVVKWNGTVWEKDVDYTFEQYQNSVFVGLADKSSLVLSGDATFSVYFPQGAFTIDGAESPEIDHTITVLVPKTYGVVINHPDVTVDIDNVQSPSQLAVLHISFPDAQKAEVAHASGVSLRHNDYEYFQTATIEPVEGAEVPTFKLTFPTAPTSNGAYTLSVDHGTFLLDDYYTSPAFEKVFGDFTTSVDDPIFNDGADTTVYGLDGQVIMRNASAASIKSLEKGLYIIGGKKFIKK